MLTPGSSSSCNSFSSLSCYPFTSVPHSHLPATLEPQTTSRTRAALKAPPHPPSAYYEAAKPVSCSSKSFWATLLRTRSSEIEVRLDGGRSELLWCHEVEETRKERRESPFAELHWG